jgi:hypothetical protein
MMRERRAVAGAGDVDGEWKLTSEIFWQADSSNSCKVRQCLSFSTLASSCIHRIHVNFGWILDQSICSELCFFVLSEIGKVQL